MERALDGGEFRRWRRLLSVGTVLIVLSLTAAVGVTPAAATGVAVPYEGTPGADPAVGWVAYADEDVASCPIDASLTGPDRGGAFLVTGPQGDDYLDVWAGAGHPTQVQSTIYRTDWEPTENPGVVTFQGRATQTAAISDNLQAVEIQLADNKEIQGSTDIRSVQYAARLRRDAGVVGQVDLWVDDGSGGDWVPTTPVENLPVPFDHLPVTIRIEANLDTETYVSVSVAVGAFSAPVQDVNGLSAGTVIQPGWEVSRTFALELSTNPVGGACRVRAPGEVAELRYDLTHSGIVGCPMDDDTLPCLRPETGMHPATFLHWDILSGTFDGWSIDGKHVIVDQALGTWGDRVGAGDVSGNGVEDLVAYDPGSGTWDAIDIDGDPLATGVFLNAGPGEVMLGDLDDNGVQDFVVWRPSTGRWRAKNLAGQKVFDRFFGGPGEVPLIGDVDGDGDDDQVLWRRSDGRWRAEDEAGVALIPVGTVSGRSQDQPLLGDVDGDGDDDLLMRRSNGIWEALDAGTGSALPVVGRWGNGRDDARVADIDGDGVDELVAWRPAWNRWQATRLDGTVVLTRFVAGAGHGQMAELGG